MGETLFLDEMFNGGPIWAMHLIQWAAARSYWTRARNLLWATIIAFFSVPLLSSSLLGLRNTFYATRGSRWKMIQQETHKRGLSFLSQPLGIHHPPGVSLTQVAVQSHQRCVYTSDTCCTCTSFLPGGCNIWCSTELNFSWHLYTSTRQAFIFSGHLLHWFRCAWGEPWQGVSLSMKFGAKDCSFSKHLTGF